MIVTQSQRRANLIAVIAPFVIFVVATVVFWGSFVDATDIFVFVLMYLIAGFGITIGYHRLMTHRAFQSYKTIEYLFAIAGSMAVQGPVIDWVADHRKHHAHSDVEGDPHSPHVDAGDGWLGSLSGLYHAHMGWLFVNNGQAWRRKYAPDLMEDKGLRKINKNFRWIVLLGIFMPFLIGLAITGTIEGALMAALWGGPIRIFFQHHVTWSINSICHFFGRRRFDVDDHSTNVFWLALPSLGESWHHNHHAFPRSAAHGLKWWEIDLSALLIKAMRLTGVAWNVTLISADRQKAKLAGPAIGLPEDKEKLAA